MAPTPRPAGVPITQERVAGNQQSGLGADLHACEDNPHDVTGAHAIRHPVLGQDWLRRLAKEGAKIQKPV